MFPFVLSVWFMQNQSRAKHLVWSVLIQDQSGVTSNSQLQIWFLSSFGTGHPRVSDQNGVSLLYIMFEIHHSGREPSIIFLEARTFHVLCSGLETGNIWVRRTIFKAIFCSVIWEVGFGGGIVNSQLHGVPETPKLVPVRTEQKIVQFCLEMDLFGGISYRRQRMKSSLSLLFKQSTENRAHLSLQTYAAWAVWCGIGL